MANDDTIHFRHADGRWVLLVLSLRRIDRTEGVKTKGQIHVYSIYENPKAMRAAAAKMCTAMHSDGYRRVAKLGRFVGVPPKQWLNAALVAKKPRRPALAGEPRNALEARIAHLAATPGVTLYWKCGKPASATSLARAEKQLGRPLSPSLRAFLSTHNGLLVQWKLEATGWEVSFEILSLREMLKESNARGAVLTTKAGIILPVTPTYDRSVLGVVLRARGEAKVVEWKDPPDDKPDVLAPNFATYLTGAIKNYFVIANSRDVAHKWLPAIRRRLGP